MLSTAEQLKQTEKLAAQYGSAFDVLLQIDRNNASAQLGDICRPNYPSVVNWYRVPNERT